MRKYLRAFSLSIEQYTHNRLDFLLGRLRNIVVLILLYYVWIAVSGTTGKFSFFTTNELVTYVILANILRSFIFGSQSRRIAIEINDGIFSVYLIRPINHFVLFYFRELAERLILTISALVEIIVFISILNIQIELPVNTTHVFWFLLSVFLAHALYYVMSYTVNLIAFWSREAMGPRFLFEWFLEFASGAYFPLTILRHGFFLFLGTLPFIGVMFIPLMIYLEKIHCDHIPSYITIQLWWIVASGILAYVIWKKGLKKYTGEGI